MSEPLTPDPAPARPEYRAYSGVADAAADFRGIGGDLLKSFPPLAPPAPIHDSLPGAIDPTREGFGVRKPHRK
jgi:hypothetical protein